MKLEISDNVVGEDVAERWVQVLDYLGRLMSIDQSDQLVRFTFLYEKRKGTLTWRVALSSPRLCTSH